ncbi:hypothetical protein EDC96DRAFT_451313, partial [Choanephora cucurbitarum]
YNTDRNFERTLILRHDIVYRWKENGIGFQMNYVFVDKARFRTQTIGNNSAIVQARNRREPNVTTVDCISPFGTINFSNVGLLERSNMEGI